MQSGDQPIAGLMINEMITSPVCKSMRKNKMTTEKEKLAITKYDLLYEQRVTRVETSMENLAIVCKNLSQDVREIKSEIKSDFRWLFTLIIGSNAGLFALMAHGFKWF